MTLAEGLDTYLRGIPDIFDVIPSINWSNYPETVETNKIVYWKVDDIQVYGSFQTNEFWKFVTVHQNIKLCQSVSNDLFKNLHDNKGTSIGGVMVSYIFNESDQDPVLREDGFYEVIQIYKIKRHLKSYDER